MESKNLKRQHFFEFDIGKNKAEIFAKRYSSLYGMDISYVADKFSLKALAEQKHYYNIYNYIIFDHTDNKKARESIEEVLKIDHDSKRSIIISTGNESDYGQVLISSNDISRDVNRKRLLFNQFSDILYTIDNPVAGKTYNIRGLPSLLEIYKDFKDTETPSCTDITLIDDQSMPINSLVAQLAYNAFYMLVAGKSLNYNMVRCNINNTYSTNYISHPFDARDLFCKALLGDSSLEAIEFLRTINKYYNKTYEDFNTHLREFSSIAIKEKNIKYSSFLSDLLSRLNLLTEDAKQIIINYSGGDENANI